MNTSLFELFKIGIGPSSSHTVGPMRAALRFLRELSDDQLASTARITVDLYGSLALTGIGHATDRAILMGLLEQSPDTVDLASIDGCIEHLRASRELRIHNTHSVAFDPVADLRFHRDQMYPVVGETTHPNGMRFTALNGNDKAIVEHVFYSIGGGFILSAAEYSNSGDAKKREVPYAYSSAAELLALGEQHKLTIAQIVLANEVALLADATITRRIERIVSPARPDSQTPGFLSTTTAALAPLTSHLAPESSPALLQQPQVRSDGVPSSPGNHHRSKAESHIFAAILTLWQTMQQCIERGIATEGTLPGGLNVRRRAPGLAARLARLAETGKPLDPLAPMDSVTLVAMAVNEENAAGGRVVTAPTNGAAGVIPAIAHFYLNHASLELNDEEKQSGLLRYFLTAAAIGILYKENASISGAEVGCQGEVGVACSMAAGGLVAALGGDNNAVEHAAEIAMEHNLGMTCDPIGGLVQIPCIERNGMGAIKAVNAARLAMADPGTHKISLDQVIDTMYRTGMDMQSRYKETSLAGLALNIIEC